MAAVRPPPAPPGPDIGNLRSRASNGTPNSGQQDPGLHGTSQDPGQSVHPQQHISTRPFFYVPVAPPPPFLHYQWPMPFSYNPFGGFPGMGYGMVMPPFPPPPYMEAPAYIIPPQHIQPADYRRLLNPQVPTPCAPYQNPTQTRRIRPSHAVPVRGTVNSEVQTEPTQRSDSGYSEGSPLVSSDSGHGTASSSPSSSSSSQRQGSADVENAASPNRSANEDQQVAQQSKSSLVKHKVPCPEGAKVIEESRASLETQNRCKNGGVETVAPCRNDHCNIWLASSPDSMSPECSSSHQEDEAVKERRISVPDILMGWEGGTPQMAKLNVADRVVPQKEDQLPPKGTGVEPETPQSLAGLQNAPVVATADCEDDEDVQSSKDGETFKILKLPLPLHELLLESSRENETVNLTGSLQPIQEELLQSLNQSHKLTDHEQEITNDTIPQEDTTDIPYQMSFNSSHLKRKLNESVWSVESLVPFIPTKEWMVQNGMFEPEVIVEMTEEDQTADQLTQNVKLMAKAAKERRQSRRFSPSDSVPVSDNWLISSTPAGKLNLPTNAADMQSQISANENKTGSSKQGQNAVPHNKDPSNFPACPQSKMLSSPPEEDLGVSRSSEPVANGSPNQETSNVPEQQMERPCTPEQETLSLNCAAVENVSSTLNKRVDMEAESSVNGIVDSLRSQQLCIPMTDLKMAEVSPSKSLLVDCGVQCDYHETNCCFQMLRTRESMEPYERNLKYPDVRRAYNGKAEGFHNGNIQKNQRKPWKKRHQEKHYNQQEAYNGYCGKPKSRGEDGKYPHQLLQ